MFRRIAPLGIAVLAGLIATSATASDLDIINAPEIDVSGSTVAEGWYIRGDLGYSGWVKHDKPNYRIDAILGYEYGPVAVHRDDMIIR